MPISRIESKLQYWLVNEKQNERQQQQKTSQYSGNAGQAQGNGYRQKLSPSERFRQQLIQKGKSQPSEPASPVVPDATVLPKDPVVPEVIEAQSTEVKVAAPNAAGSGASQQVPVVDQDPAELELTDCGIHARRPPRRTEKPAGIPIR